MTPAAQGRHCAACDKVVVDFTRMTDGELLTYLEQSRGATCGRFQAQQLNRPLALPTPVTSSWYRRGVALAAMLGIGVASASAVQAQITSSPNQVPKVITLGMVAVPQPLRPGPLLPTVRGVVTDSATQQPLPGVTVLIAGTTIGAATGTDGAFELQLPEHFQQEKIVLQYTYIGYHMQEQQVTLPQHSMLRTVLTPDTQMLSGEVVIVAGGAYAYYPWYTPRGFWQRLRRPFRR